MLTPKGKNLIIVGLVIACGILGGGLVLTQFSGQTPPKAEENILTPEEAANIALSYINQALLAGRVEAKLVGEIEEEMGLYKFQIDIQGEKLYSYISKDGKVLFPQGINLEEEKIKAEAKPETTEGNFSVSEEEVCKENGKPIIYFFGSAGCPHCRWEHPIVEEVADKFTNFISFHNNMDVNQDMDIFQKYSTGGIPTIVLGCKYYRVGSGERIGKEKEKEVLTSLICDLTGNQPATVCQ